MKKFLTMITLSSALLLTACGTDNDTAAPADETDGGMYRIEDANFDENGWKESLEIVMADGEITDVHFESVDEDGNQKIDNDDYQEMMESTVDVGPQQYIPALEEDLVEKQDPADVDVVTGATHTSEKFKDYAAQLIDAAEAGDTETIVIDNDAE